MICFLLFLFQKLDQTRRKNENKKSDYSPSANVEQIPNMKKCYEIYK